MGPALLRPPRASLGLLCAVRQGADPPPPRTVVLFLLFGIFVLALQRDVSCGARKNTGEIRFLSQRDLRSETTSGLGRPAAAAVPGGSGPSLPPCPLLLCGPASFFKAMHFFRRPAPDLPAGRSSAAKETAQGLQLSQVLPCPSPLSLSSLLTGLKRASPYWLVLQ